MRDETPPPEEVHAQMDFEVATRLLRGVRRGLLAEEDIQIRDLVGLVKAVVANKRRHRAYDVFVCHNTADKREILKLARMLEAREILPWVDHVDIRPGLPWQSQLESQLSTVRAAVVCIGEGGLGPWQAAESQVLLEQLLKRGCPVIPVALWSCTDEPELPVFLSSVSWVRLGRKGPPDPMSQLVYGITGAQE